MEDPVAYLWLFPSTDFAGWKSLEHEQTAIKTYEDYVSYQASRRVDLQRRGKKVVLVRLALESMIEELSNRNLSYSTAARAFVLQAAHNSHLSNGPC